MTLERFVVPPWNTAMRHRRLVWQSPRLRIHSYSKTTLRRVAMRPRGPSQARAAVTRRPYERCTASVAGSWRAQDAACDLGVRPMTWSVAVHERKVRHRHAHRDGAVTRLLRTRVTPRASRSHLSRSARAISPEPQTYEYTSFVLQIADTAAPATVSERPERAARVLAEEKHGGAAQRAGNSKRRDDPGDQSLERCVSAPPTAGRHRLPLTRLAPARWAADELARPRCGPAAKSGDGRSQSVDRRYLLTGVLATRIGARGAARP